VARRFASLQTLVIAGLLVQLPILAVAQGTPAATPGYVPPRTPDGQPSIQGYWQSMPGGSYSIENLELQAIYQQNRRDPTREGKSRIIDPPNGKIPYQPWAAALAKKYLDVHLDPPGPQFLDGVARCIVQGVPRGMYQGEYEILQLPGYVVFMMGPNHQYRIVPLDGRPALGKDIQLYMGDSRGRWEGNTLVITSANYTNKTWFDIVGSFHTEAFRLTERLTPVGANRIDYQATVEDPKAYTRPWTLATTLARITEKNYEIIEEACHEGERSAGEILTRPGR
jgi:hypothetical protein